MPPPPFIIYGLPRSRTYWLSRFLSYGDTKCGHDELRYIRGLDDLRSLLDMPSFGSVETAAAPYWRLIHAMRPDIKTVIVRRPVLDVVDSLIATGVLFDKPKLTSHIRRLDAKLDQIKARVPGVLEVQFGDLNRHEACVRLFRNCVGQELDPLWFYTMRSTHLTIDLEAMVRYCAAHRPQLERVGRLAKQRILAKMSRRPVSSDAMTFQQEMLDVVIPDAQRLFSQHSVEVGEVPDSWATKNIPLLQALEHLGALYVTTARSNGRMYGYVMSIIAPALDSESGVDSINTAFYVSPDAPGVGLKLQRASVEFLRTRGVDQAAFRAGTRGSGDKVAAIFKRLGAVDAGHMFTLDLKEVA